MPQAIRFCIDRKENEVTIRDRLAQAASLFLAVGVGMLAVNCTAHAVTSVTAANSAQIFALINPGLDSGPFTPAANQGVYMMGVCNTSGDSGIGYAALLHVTGHGHSWTGLNSRAIPANTTAGFHVTATGTNIVSIDVNGNLIIQVNDADSLRVHNSSGGAILSCVVTLFW